MNGFPSRPRVTLKLAQTLDGRIATRTGNSRWVTSPASRAMGHALRATHDAVLVGIGTVLADNPHLTVRLAPGPNPRRIVLDSTLRLPLDSAVLQAKEASVTVVTLEPEDSARAEEIRYLGGEVLTVPGLNGRVDLGTALRVLYRLGMRSVLVEGGAEVATEFMRQQLVDELVLFIAPKIIGSGIDAIGELNVTEMANAVIFSSSVVEKLEDDMMFRGKPIWPDERRDR